MEGSLYPLSQVQTTQVKGTINQQVKREGNPKHGMFLATIALRVFFAFPFLIGLKFKQSNQDHECKQEKVVV